MASAHQVVISWADSTDSGAGYNVYRSTTKGGEPGSAPLNGTTPLAAGVTSFTDSTVTAGTWFYEVWAVENGVQSASPTNELTVSLPPGPASNLVLVSAS